MGLHLRLKASVDLSGYSGESLAILTALKHYGMVLADNGTDFSITGTYDPGWDSAALDAVRSIPASDLEVIQTGTIITP